MSWYYKVCVAALVAGAAGCGPSSWTTPVTRLDAMVLSAWGDGPHDVFFAGGALGGKPGALALHFDGQNWIDLQPPQMASLWWVFGRGPRDVWFCGEYGAILHWDGTGFSAARTPTQQILYGVWGAAGNDLWAVGGAPGASSVVLHYDGASWSEAAGVPQNGGAYFKVWGSSPSDVFIVGEYGAILHFDGSAWKKMASGLGKTVRLLTVAGRSANDVYAVGGLGVAAAVHYDGTAWSPIPGLDLSSSSGLSGVAVTPAGDVAITGLAGVKLRGRGAVWTDDSRLPPQTDLHGVWLDGPDDIFAAGGNLNSPPGFTHQGLVAHYGPDIPARK